MGKAQCLSLRKIGSTLCKLIVVVERAGSKEAVVSDTGNRKSLIDVHH